MLMLLILVMILVMMKGVGVLVVKYYEQRERTNWKSSWQKKCSKGWSLEKMQEDTRTSADGCANDCCAVAPA
jgi:hypothetical protein